MQHEKLRFGIQQHLQPPLSPQSPPPLPEDKVEVE